MNKSSFIPISTFQISAIIHSQSPIAYAPIKGDEVAGSFYAFPYNDGSLVVIEANGLPESVKSEKSNVFVTNIKKDKKLLDSSQYHKPENGPIFDASDELPLLFSYHGQAWTAFFTQYCEPNAFHGLTIEIHKPKEETLDIGQQIARGKIIAL